MKQIEGDHNVDKTYLKALKEKNPDIKIYPRIYIEGNLYENLQHLTNPHELSIIAEEFVRICKKYDQEFDGFVFDTPLLTVVNQLSFDLLGLVRLINEKLEAINKNLIISLLANQKPTKTSSATLEKLLMMSHKLLYCTYDYVSSKPGEYPIAPYEWVEQQLQTFFETDLSLQMIQRKLMMGIPFYGKKIDFRAGKMDTIINNQYIEILRNHRTKVEWNKLNKECLIQLRDSGNSGVSAQIIYPCLKFIQSRLQLFENYGVGAFVWEGGQGLEYFYELF